MRRKLSHKDEKGMSLDIYPRLIKHDIPSSYLYTSPLLPRFNGSLANITCLLGTANIDEHDDHEEVDEETTGHLHREIEKAERDNQPEGRPGSFLNRLISHGNKKTEDQLAGEHAAQGGLSREPQGGARAPGAADANSHAAASTS